MGPMGTEVVENGFSSVFHEVASYLGVNPGTNRRVAKLEFSGIWRLGAKVGEKHVIAGETVEVRFQV